MRTKQSSWAPLNKYDLLLDHLRRMQEASLLICLTEDCIVVGMHPIEGMAEGRDQMLMKIAAEGESRQTALQVWRNTDTVRSLIVEFIARCKVHFAVSSELHIHDDLE